MLELATRIEAEEKGAAEAFAALAADQRARIARTLARRDALQDLLGRLRGDRDRLSAQLALARQNAAALETGVREEVERLEASHLQERTRLESFLPEVDQAIATAESELMQLAEGLDRMLRGAVPEQAQEASTDFADVTAALLSQAPQDMPMRRLPGGRSLFELPERSVRLQVRGGATLGLVTGVVVSGPPPRVLGFVAEVEDGAGVIPAADVVALRQGTVLVRDKYRLLDAAALPEESTRVIFPVSRPSRGHGQDEDAGLEQEADAGQAAMAEAAPGLLDLAPAPASAAAQEEEEVPTEVALSDPDTPAAVPEPQREAAEVIFAEPPAPAGAWPPDAAAQGEEAASQEDSAGAGDPELPETAAEAGGTTPGPMAGDEEEGGQLPASLLPSAEPEAAPPEEAQPEATSSAAEPLTASPPQGVGGGVAGDGRDEGLTAAEEDRTRALAAADVRASAEVTHPDLAPGFAPSADAVEPEKTLDRADDQQAEPPRDTAAPVEGETAGPPLEPAQEPGPAVATPRAAAPEQADVEPRWPAGVPLPAWQMAGDSGEPAALPRQRTVAAPHPRPAAGGPPLPPQPPAARQPEPPAAARVAPAGASLNILAFISGKVVGRDLMAPDGRLVASQGTRITPDLVAEVETLGLLPEMIVYMTMAEASR